MSTNQSGVELIGKTISDAVKVHATGLDISEDLTFDQWVGVGQELRHSVRSWQWWAGDWYHFGQFKFGEKQDIGRKVAEIFGVDLKTLQNCASVCRSVESSRRQELLSYSHHQMVSALEPDQQAKALTKAVQSGFTSRQLRDYVQESNPPRDKAPREKCPECETFMETRSTRKEVRHFYCPECKENRQMERRRPLMGAIADKKLLGALMKLCDVSEFGENKGLYDTIPRDAVPRRIELVGGKVKLVFSHHSFPLTNDSQNIPILNTKFEV